MKAKLIYSILILCLAFSCATDQSVEQSEELSIVSVARQSSGPIDILVYCNIMDTVCYEMHLAIKQTFEQFPPNAFNLVWKNGLRHGGEYWDYLALQLEHCYYSNFDMDEFVFFVDRFYKETNPLQRRTYVKLAAREGRIKEYAREVRALSVNIMSDMNCDTERFEACLKRGVASFAIMRVREIMSRSLPRDKYVLIVGDTVWSMTEHELFSFSQLRSLLQRKRSEQN